MTFVAYSTGEHSIVLMGQNDASFTTNPRVIPSLQNRGVISVVLGDYHFGALLENGKLLTWGAPGSTGLGDPFKIEPGQPGGFRTLQDREMNGFVSLPDVHVPTEVRFDHGLKKPRERFAFVAAAAGWHMGAIVVDLEEVSNLLVWGCYEILIGL
jgi:SCF-associated factor 1